jgi:ArsR family transcriptional regulator, lead/cadmium/zinc/bismuth-responsive transcriptional repressor
VSVAHPTPPEETCDGAHLRPPRPSPPASVVERAAAIFRAAGDPGRLWLLERLQAGERCVTDLAEEAGDALSTVSQRLRTLRNEGLVRRRRDGKHFYYALMDDHIAELVRSAVDHAWEEHETHPNPTPSTTGDHR